MGLILHLLGRAIGMGGAQTAASADSTAQYHNPAALALIRSADQDGADAESLTTSFEGHINRTESRFGWDLFDIQVGANLNGDVTAIIDELNALDFDTIGDIDSLDPDVVENLVRVAGLLSSFIEES